MGALRCTNRQVIIDGKNISEYVDDISFEDYPDTWHNEPGTIWLWDFDHDTDEGPKSFKLSGRVVVAIPLQNQWLLIHMADWKDGQKVRTFIDKETYNKMYEQRYLQVS